MGSNISSLEDLYDHKKRTRIDRGLHKYIIIELKGNGETVEFVRSKKYAEFHGNILERFCSKIEGIKLNGKPLLNICRVDSPGGGRISYNGTKMKIYGYSKSFG